jgi:hypothetical protein
VRDAPCRVSAQSHKSTSYDYAWIETSTMTNTDTARQSSGGRTTLHWHVAPPNHIPVMETLRWCYNFVLPLGLCPWAAASLQELQLLTTSGDDEYDVDESKDSSVRLEKTKTSAMQFFSVKNSEDMESAVHHVTRIFRDAVVQKAIDPSVAIFFVLCEDRSWDFADFYDWFCTVEEDDWDGDYNIDKGDDDDLLSQVTLAPFHPGWMFEDDGAAATNPSLQFEKKSPFPTVTLVWTDIIDAAGPAVSSKIAAQNEITLGKKSVEELAAMYQQSVYDYVPPTE